MRISANPINVWLLGVVCRPSACRRKWKTISSRANGVMHSSSDGISVRNVSRATMLHESEPDPGAPGIVIRISLGEAGVAAVVAVCVALARLRKKPRPGH